MSRVKAFGYVKLNGTESKSEEKQKNGIEQYAAARGIQIVRMYRENEFLQHGPKRSVLLEMLLDLEDNEQEIRTLVVERIDQLAEDLTVQLSVVWELRCQGFEVISVLEPDVWNPAISPRE